ncbi:putative secreted protein (Por secretion system target) [Algoriphagus boseongensis]|uniref:Putative secreted protein (Por secretion system target) n=1 Tax=Algoriphagus boseongensis TaxID=1442587 RepID=A0A4R6T170_9BACT|nr:T9SS type A sorting domain-containing protein [Algoriphagus boseongensis]TDQ13792.1 putative secreted protein (Por secretion system target) [Algoriphagus boseongensis]
MIFFYSGGVCQEINSYKTIVSGDFPNPAIWVVWNGSTWNPASSKPNSTNDIYIDQTHTLRLVANEEVKSVFINAETGAGQKLNLNNFNLNIYGTLNAFSGPAPGTPDNAWNSQNWIGNSISSRITFKGDSRVIIRKSSWSAQTTQSRFSVIFEANPGETFTLEAPLKALSFTVRSGILFQKIDTSVIPNACFTLSFNTETTVYGIGPFGNMSIEDGATFISECNANILNRSTSGSISALNFDLQNGGTLILEGNAPKIEAANFQLNGNLIFRGGTSPKSYLGSSYPDAATPQAAKNIELQGNQNLTLPNTLFLFGDLIKSGSGNFITNSTHLILAGSSNQEIKGFSLSIQDLTLSKTGGIFFPKNDLTITRSLTLTQGRIDFEGKNLIFNTSGLGNYSFTGGSWKNMGLLTLSNLPAVLTSSNSTFPFEDSKNGGIRKVQLLGNSPGGSLNISFTEFKGADFDPGFDDSDGSPILYRLFSFFQFSGSNLNSTPIELRISADKLIVDNVDDLRIVCTGYPAPGTHIPGTDPVNLWAIRSLKWEDLAGKNFTVGSYRVLSILPVIWLSEKAETKPQGNLISWTLASEKDNLLFEIYRSEDWEKGWEKVGTIPSKGNSSTKVDYEFLDQTSDIFRSYFYQIRQFDLLGESWSKVLSTEPLKKWEKPHLLIFPNPYSSGKLRLEFPRTNDQYAWVSIQNSSGKSLFNGPLDENTISDFIEPLSPGIYFITIISGSNQYSGKLIKK